MKRDIALVTLALTVMAASAAFLVAGPLNPPAGPVAPTYKTLGEVEPRIALSSTNTPGDAGSIYKITHRGSYYLTGDIAGIAGKAAVIVSVDHVTLDLAGFSIVGGSVGVQATAAPNASRLNLTVRNGSISFASGSGVEALVADGAVIEDLTMNSCLAGGVFCGPSARVSRCTSQHGSFGISVGINARVTDCIASFNDVSGIVLHDGSTATNCTATNNTLRGIDAYNNTTTLHCQVGYNLENGIDGFDTTIVDDCTIFNNGGDGVHAGVDSVIKNSTIDRNGGNGANFGSGRINDCTLNNNCLTLGEAAAGIKVTGDSGTRIEGNAVSNCATGIYVSGNGCFIVRNTGHNHTVAFILPDATVYTLGQIVYEAGQQYITHDNPWINFYH